MAIRNITEIRIAAGLIRRPEAFATTVAYQMLGDNLFGFKSTLALPIAIMIRPQFGSCPAIAVFTKGEFAIVKHIFFATIYYT